MAARWNSINNQAQSAHLSISHTTEHAIAEVILES